MPISMESLQAFDRVITRASLSASSDQVTITKSRPAWPIILMPPSGASENRPDAWR